MPHSPPVPRTAGLARANKSLRLQGPGARRWSAKHGDRPSCVRYQVDAGGQRRQTTVELVLDEATKLRREATGRARG